VAGVFLCLGLGWAGAVIVAKRFGLTIEGNRTSWAGMGEKYVEFLSVFGGDDECSSSIFIFLNARYRIRFLEKVFGLPELPLPHSGCDRRRLTGLKLNQLFWHVSCCFS
jgi:hypothetical protein